LVAGKRAQAQHGQSPRSGHIEDLSSGRNTISGLRLPCAIDQVASNRPQFQAPRLRSGQSAERFSTSGLIDAVAVHRNSQVFNELQGRRSGRAGGCRNRVFDNVSILP
jgi:hypothetical protein